MIYSNSFKYSITKYPDNTPKIDMNPIDLSGSIYITWKYDSMDELFILQCIVDMIRNIRPDIVLRLIMPYIPNARMDRIHSLGEAFTLKSFANTINSMNFNRVIVSNAHSDVSLALINNIDDVGYEEIVLFLTKYKLKFDTIMFPDSGACKRYTKISEITKYPIIYGQKNRNWSTGQILGLDIIGDINNIKSKDILIIDDICSKGGTFKYSAMKLKELGANNIYLYISHCENVIDLKSLNRAGISRVFTTDSICRLEHIDNKDYIELVMNSKEGDM